VQQAWAVSHYELDSTGGKFWQNLFDRMFILLIEGLRAGLVSAEIAFGPSPPKCMPNCLVVEKSRTLFMANYFSNSLFTLTFNALMS
jgi:hypothetical protein